MEIEITQSGDIRERLNELANGQVPTSRRNFIQSVALQTLQETAQNNPVRTGRSRAAWNAAARRPDKPKPDVTCGSVIARLRGLPLCLQRRHGRQRVYGNQLPRT